MDGRERRDVRRSPRRAHGAVHPAHPHRAARRRAPGGRAAEPPPGTHARSDRRGRRLHDPVTGALRRHPRAHRHPHPRSGERGPGAQHVLPRTARALGPRLARRGAGGGARCSTGDGLHAASPTLLRRPARRGARPDPRAARRGGHQRLPRVRRRGDRDRRSRQPLHGGVPAQLPRPGPRGHHRHRGPRAPHRPTPRARRPLADALAADRGGRTMTDIGTVALRTVEHLGYSGLAVGVAALIAVPLGLVIGHTGRGPWTVRVANAPRALPSLGLIALLVLLIGAGVVPPTIALVGLAIPPILANTSAGIAHADPAAVDAARAMGMTERQVLVQVELPIALPLVVGGFRAATLQVVATATIA